MAVGSIHARTASCAGEAYLDKKSAESIGFKIDIHATRRAVADMGLSPEDGVALMKDQAPLSPRQETQLYLCLSRIAAGECINYPNR